MTGGKAFGERKFESERKRIKADLIDSPLAKVAQGDVSAKLTLKARAEAQVAAAAAVFAGKKEPDFIKARADAQTAVDTLAAHANKASAQTSLTDAKAKLAAADAHAAKKEYPEGMQRSMEAQVLCAHAKKLADDVAAFQKSRDSVVAQVYALDRFLDGPTITKVDAEVNKADKQAQGPPPDIATAKTTMAAIRTALSDFFKRNVDDVKARLAKIDALGAGAKAAVAGDLANGRTLVAEAEAALNADEWARSIAAALSALDFLAPSERIAARRDGFDTQRTASVAAIANVKANDAVKGYSLTLEMRLDEADALAEPKALQFEQGKRVLEEIAARCAVLLAAAPSITTTNTLRDAAQKDLAALDTGPAATATQALRDAARAKLLAAANTTAIYPGGNDLARGVETALATTRRASEDVAQAKTLAAGLAAAIKADTAAANPADQAGLSKALKALRKDLAAARAAKPPADAETEFKKADTAAADADAALRKKDGAKAADALKKAAAAVTAGRAIAVEQAQAATLLAAVEARRKTLGALPNAAKLKPKLDELDKALDAARKATGSAAIVQTRAADDLATAAEHADAARKAFDTEAATVDTMIAAVTDVKTNADLVKLADAAKAKADELKFDDATKALLAVRQRAGKARVTALAAKKPLDAATLAAVADDLTTHGAAADVDSLLEKLPAGTDPAAAAAIAKGRFGIEFSADAGAPPAEELKSVQAICKLLGRVPKDVRDNPSLKSLKHTDALPPNAGGMYEQGSATMKLHGRPKANNQLFGKNQLAPEWPLPPPGTLPKGVSQLPAAIDKDFQVVNENTPVDVLDWASLHEVGHGIDDANTYMLRNQSSPDHGGWTSYGSNVKPIADAVGAHFGFYQTAEQQKYVLDTLMSLPPTDPPAPDKKVDWAKRKTEFDNWHAIATSEDVYRRQADCDKITIGKLIYHEAYPRQWVSYLADARKQGLTGYQFRHPGEWFSELYAGYKSGKLGAKHPARVWLSKLSK